jgi:hypothetical protein
VLVETYEPGAGVSGYMRAPKAINARIVALGVDTYLKMLLEVRARACLPAWLSCGLCRWQQGLSGRAQRTPA